MTAQTQPPAQSSKSHQILWAFLFDYVVLAGISLGLYYFAPLEWGINPYETFVALVILHLVASFRTVHAQRIGGILFFGAFVKEVSPGWEVVPFLSCKLITEDGKTIQRQFPDEPEKIDKTGGDIPAPGKVFPIRVTHAAKDGSKDPLDQRITTETTAIIRFRILRGSFKKFYESVGTVDEAVRQLRDTVESEIKQQFASKTVAETLLAQAALNASLKQKVDHIVQNWGVEVIQVEIVEIGFNHDINKSMSNAVAAEFNRRATVATAEGEKTRLTLEGEGKADAEKKMLEARAKGHAAYLKAEAMGLAALAKVAKTDEGKFMQAMKVLEEGFAKGNTTFFDSQMILNAAQTVETIIAKAKGGGA